ncbi:MAG: AbrB/MazE/SpoVT family DNA-binding domain-containing protein [Planctomycetes bacterium]|nr:AbrB/MazE/SpoVT family DNA-binding domain-containing protein [Planctomycetota bacterium]
MKAQIQKWGNSLALRIPKAFAEEISIDHGSNVELSLKKGSLVIHPVETRAYSLDEFLSRVNKDNIHAEFDFGSPVGKELL